MYLYLQGLGQQQSPGSFHSRVLSQHAVTVSGRLSCLCKHTIHWLGSTHSWLAALNEVLETFHLCAAVCSVLD